MIDPIKETKRLQHLLCKNEERKYYRFRGSHFYGGIASADCIGCMLDCIFCWSQKPRLHPETSGLFYSPQKVAKKLVAIAHHNNYSKVRITGNEPTLCKEHLLKIISLIPDNLLFILETNGILLNKTYVESLSRFPNIHVRVSLKGGTPGLFSKITNAPPAYFDSQINSLRILFEHSVPCHPAIMKDFLNRANVEGLRKTLTSIHPILAKKLEFETLIHYPFVDQALREKNIVTTQG